MAKKIEPTIKTEAVKPVKKAASAKTKPTATEVKPAAVQNEFEEKAAKPIKKVAAAKTKKEFVITNDEIAQRAYFISERRQQNGIEGDSHNDWLEAESQLRDEAHQ